MSKLEEALNEIDNAPHDCFKGVTEADEGIIIDGKEFVPILKAAKAWNTFEKYVRESKSGDPKTTVAFGIAIALQQYNGEQHE